MDHAVKTSKLKPWDKLSFENEELESLYQRYTLKMQRFSIIGVVSLFVIFCMVMVTLSFFYSNLLTLHVSHLARIFHLHFSLKSYLLIHFYFSEYIQFADVSFIFDNTDIIAVSCHTRHVSVIIMLWNPIGCIHFMHYVDASS